MALSHDKEWAKQADEATARRAKENHPWFVKKDNVDCDMCNDTGVMSTGSELDSCFCKRVDNYVKNHKEW